MELPLRPPPLPSPPHRRARRSLAKGLHSSCEATLHHQAHQGRHEVHLHALRPPRQHPRLRPPRRQPPHPGRHRHQSARHQRASRARNVLLPRHPAAHLAHLTSASGFRVSGFWFLVSGVGCSSLGTWVRYGPRKNSYLTAEFISLLGLRSARSLADRGVRSTRSSGLPASGKVLFTFLLLGVYPPWS